MDEFHGQASARISAAPKLVFATLTDVSRLPEWNTAIEKVIDRPDRLVTDTEWTVRMHPPHMPSWGSISRVLVLDAGRMHFSYETRNADGNPSRAVWNWTVDEVEGQAQVTVKWDCYLKTLDRRLLAGPVRKRQLSREVPRSLTSLAVAVTSEPRG